MSVLCKCPALLLLLFVIFILIISLICIVILTAVSIITIFRSFRCLTQEALARKNERLSSWSSRGALRMVSHFKVMWRLVHSPSPCFWGTLSLVQGCLT